MATTQRAVRAHVHWGMKDVAVLAVITYPLLAYAFWDWGAPIASLVLMVNWVLAIWVFFLADTKIDVDDQGVRLTAPHGVYRMDWTEIKSVELKGQTAHFYGENKVVGYNLLLAGRGKGELRRFVVQSIQQHQIPAGRPVGIRNSDLNRLLRNARVRGWRLFN